jgi:hypothetical protein
MSTIEETTVFCAACGSKPTGRRTSFIQFRPDLEFRPQDAALHDALLNHGVPYCGYAAEISASAARPAR